MSQMNPKKLLNNNAILLPLRDQHRCEYGFHGKRVNRSENFLHLSAFRLLEKNAKMFAFFAKFHFNLFREKMQKFGKNAKI